MKALRIICVGVSVFIALSGNTALRAQSDSAQAQADQGVPRLV